MESLSVIVPAHNNAAKIERTLQSVAASLDHFRRQGERYRDVPAEVVVVDDGSTDDTARVAQACLDRHGFGRLVWRERASSPAAARNCGVAHSTGSLLFFLDGDDLFLPNHVHECYGVLASKPGDYIRTNVHLAHPVHPEWKQRIENSLVINLCVRRRCHELIGGFPDYHLLARNGEDFRPLLDVFFKREDVDYNRLIGALFTGYRLDTTTVEYRRYPGNAYDRQYEKFCHPPGKYAEPPDDEADFRAELAEVILRKVLHDAKRRQRHSTEEAARLDGEGRGERG
jgi:glycosyltransferase involved in cell wall biosynthesis